MVHSAWYLHLGLVALVVTVAIATLSCFVDLSEPVKLLAIMGAPIGPILIRIWEAGNRVGDQ